jgi:dTMP kinase
VGGIAVAGLQPDLTVVLDVDVETGLARLGRDPDRMERKAVGFHRAVRAGYRALVRQDPAGFRLVAARGEPAQVHTRVLREVRRVLP